MHTKLTYLLDANTLIDANRDYYPFRRVPEFWAWLSHQGTVGNIKIPIEIYEEFEDAKRKDGSRDKLAEWAACPDVKAALLFSEEADPELVTTVTIEGYGENLSDTEIETIGRDPFLISYASMDEKNRTIVTTEVSRPSKKGANRKIPDVCHDLNIRCIHNFQLLNELDFRTSWRERAACSRRAYHADRSPFAPSQSVTDKRGLT
uniref:PIN domain-containing protein n=1 Tax=Candidatus Kentrum eta TaxID=2126337 RepID=A0A450UTC7_9GAMM|nr:MAG: protein of unknown function (DUF4411) [Candidatus Kentron sp. H]VFJ96552.1 MAG: protein of unknown function (DUF4411) [Candidatus Kentron sp. H]VFK02460.1 MAG: protein of unknown function (DUF4411) [Candidatus Kentron sp. H]